MANAWPRKRFFSLTVLKNYRAWLNFQSRPTFSHFRYGFKFSTGNAPPNCLCPRWIMHPTPAQIQMDGHVTYPLTGMENKQTLNRHRKGNRTRKLLTPLPTPLCLNL